MCVLELLKPTGELAAVASGFDVIAFSSAPVSWAACYEGHLALLEGSSKPLLGRQNGRRAYRPNSASTGCMRLQVLSLFRLICITCRVISLWCYVCHSIMILLLTLYARLFFMDTLSLQEFVQSRTTLKVRS